MTARILLALCTSGVMLVSAGERAPVASLNHFWAALDDETARAIVTSDYLKTFANIVVNTVTAGENRQWTGRYLRGRQTYAEFFSTADLANSGAPARVGASGIGIGGDTPGVLDVLEQRLRLAGMPTKMTMSRRRFRTREVDWYRELDLVSTRAERDIDSSIWAMEYVSSFFEDPDAGKEAAQGPGDVISRERYLDDAYTDHLMRDVRRLELAVARDDVPAIDAIFRAAGFRVTRHTATLEARGSDFDLLIRVVPAAEIGLRQVEFVLNGAVRSRHVETIGRSTLVVGPGRAIWTFAHHSGH